jgi:hypothetical protein
MRLSLIPLIPLVLLAACAFGAEGAFENSILTLRMPDGVTLNESDFDFVPEVSWKLLLDGRAVVIGLQRDDETSQQALLDRIQANILRQVDKGSASDLSTFGNLQRCKGVEVSGRSRNPAYPGDVTVYAVTFQSGKKTVALIAIDQQNDPRFRAAIATIRQSLKLKNN